MKANATYTVADMPLGPRHWWITFVTSLGQFVGAAVATIAGVIIPMLLITTHHELSSAMQGLIGAADLMGIIVGSVVFGRLTDRFGYLPFFRLCPALVLLGAVVSILIPNVWVLVACLFLIGFGIGGEYSLDSDHESVLMPDKWKTIMLGMVKTGAAMGQIIAAAVCFGLLILWKDAAKWPDLMWIVAATGAVMLLSRIYFFESPKWLVEHGKIKEAQEALHKFLGNNVQLVIPKASPAAVQNSKAVKMSAGEFLKKNWNQVVLSGVPWACEGLGVYGIGVFIPILVMALGIEHQSAFASEIARVAESVKTTMWISCIMLPGFLIGIWMAVKKSDIVKLQTWTFWACAASLAVLLVSYHWHISVWLSLIAFMAFELFLNIGPHLVTYLLPPKIYPIAVRGQGTGIAAALGKVGAVLGVFIIPVLLKLGGGVLVLSVSAAVMAAGAIVTQVYGRRVFKTPK